MRILRIISPYFQEALQYRSRSFLWFLLALLNPAIYLLFWKAAIDSGHMTGPKVVYADIASYYLLLVIAGALLIAHIEEEVATTDIKEGGLVKYLLKPFSYFWMKFFEEFPYRIIQGSYACLGLILMIFIFGNILRLVHDPLRIVLAICISVAAYFLSFIFKMVIGIVTFWIDDFSGLQQLMFVLITLFAGFVQPIDYFHPTLRAIALATPFPYMIYYPVIAWTGALDLSLAWQVLGIQFALIGGFTLLYGYLWKKGVKEFTGVGQ
jgi:ABC-2 type transport system permease protein